MKIFSIESRYNHKLLTICGIKLKFKKKQQHKDKLDIIIDKVCNRYPLIGEPKIIPKYFKELSEVDINDKYQKLILGLDDESMINVQKFINRVRSMLKSKNYEKLLFNLSKKEIERIDERNTNFYNAIVQVDKDIWAYKNYFLPKPWIETPIFVDKCNINEFQNIDKSKAIIDAGAFIGDSALILSEYTDDKIYAFEPVNETFGLLQKTIELNNNSKIIPVKKGLADKEYRDTIYILDAASSMLDFRKDGKNSEEIEITTIDKFVEENKIKIGLIKADIEGLEQKMLLGAKNTISEQKPALMISIYHSANDFFEIKPMIESWNLGYKFKITKPFEQNILTETCLIAEVSKEN